MGIEDRLHKIVFAVLAASGCSSEGVPLATETDSGSSADAYAPEINCPQPRPADVVEVVSPLLETMCQPAPTLNFDTGVDAMDADAVSSDAADVGDAAVAETSESRDARADADGGLDPSKCELDCFKVCAGHPIPYGLTGWFCSRQGPDRAECRARAVPCGRRTAGQAPLTIEEEDAVARYQRESAFLEHLAIEAFDRLAHELSAHGAPRSLVTRALAAADDERRHAHAARALFGGEAPAVHDGAFAAPRDLEAIAVENAVEGCVREAYGALVATHQAEVAEDRGVRGFARAIARDERRHAALAFDVARWLDERLDLDARRRVSFARRRAFDELLTEVTVGASPERRLGLPTPLGARALVEGLRAVAV